MSEYPELKAIESRADTDSLEALQAERRALIKEWGPLAAKFRGAGRGDDSKRKQHRAIVAQMIADEIFQKWRNAGAKGEYKQPSEALLERLANSDERHVQFCDQLDAEYIRYVELENSITEIKERIESRAIELRAFTQEVYLQR